jgi:hypothetical protein
MIAYRCAPTCYPVPEIPNEIEETTAAGLLPTQLPPVTLDPCLLLLSEFFLVDAVDQGNWRF